MIAEGLAWLKDMATARLNPPTDVMDAARAGQGWPSAPQPATREPEAAPSPAPAPMAATGRPAWARHTIPPETSASVRGAEYGCVGLCIGGTCAVCDGLAAEITAARRIKEPVTRARREGDLRRRINALKENR